MISAEQAAATVALLLPGFVALKVFYRVGLQTKRTDLEWVLWSLLAAALINAIVDAIPAGFPPEGDFEQLLVATGLAVALGLAGSWMWTHFARHIPRASRAMEPMAWAMLVDSDWVVVGTAAGEVMGHPRVLANPSETDAPDVFLGHARWIIDGERGDEVGEGVLIPLSSIRYVWVLSWLPGRSPLG